MRICSHCGASTDHQAEPPAVVAIRSEGSTMRTHVVCGECLQHLTAWLGRRDRTLPFRDPVMHAVSR